MISTETHSSSNQPLLAKTQVSHKLPWEKAIGLGDGLEYEYLITVKGKNMTYILDKPLEINFNRKLFVCFVAKQNKEDSPICFERSSKKKIDSCSVKLYIEEKSKCLMAKSYCDIRVDYKSHLEPDGAKMVKCAETEILCFTRLFNTLTSSNGIISFDPSEAKLTFEKDSENEVVVTIRSTAASAIFVTKAKRPFSGWHQKL